MKLDSESPYHHTYPSHEHETKVIVHDDNPFIHAKDNHFMTDMLTIDKEAVKEDKHDLTSPNEKKIFQITSPPKQYLDLEDSLNSNKSFEIIVKEDFYTDNIVNKVEDVKDISIDEGVQIADKTLVEKEDAGLLASVILEQTIDNGETDSIREMADSASSYDSDYTVFYNSLTVFDKDHSDSASVHDDSDESLVENEEVGPVESSISNQSLDNWYNDLNHIVRESPICIVNEDQEYPASILHNTSDVKVPFEAVVLKSSDKSLVEKEEVTPVESSMSNHDLEDNGDNELTSERAAYASSDSSNYTVSDGQITIIDKDQEDPTCVPNNDSNEKGPFVGLFDNGVKLDMTASVISDPPANFTEIPAGSASVSYIDSDERYISASSTNSEASLDTIKPDVFNMPAKGNENSPVVAFGVDNDCDGKSSYVSLVDVGDKQDTTEPVITIISAENHLPPLQEISTDLCQLVSSIQICYNDQKQSSCEQEFQAISEESNSSPTPLSLPSEGDITSNGSKEVPANHRVPSGVITFGFDSEVASKTGRDDNKDAANSQQSEVARSSLVAEEAKIDGPTASVRCSTSLRFMQAGDSSISDASLLSDSIANSGHIPYSGSISLRSDSSTTSARSFAFPILHSEWNSSPVKMAKADRRNLRKHRGWRVGLLCCRF